MIPRWTVLLVDDEPDDLFLLNKTLTEAGFLVECHPSGEAAQRRIEQTDIASPVGAILADYNMSGMGGAPLADWVRSHSPHIGIVFVTGMDPLPKIPGQLILSKNVLDTAKLVDFLWGLLREAGVRTGFRRLETKFDALAETLVAHMDSETVSRAKIEEGILVCSKAAASACMVASTAQTQAATAISDAAALTLSTVTSRQWAKASLFLKGCILVLLLFLVGVTGLLLSIGIEALQQVQSSVEVIPGLKQQLTGDLKPTMDRIQAQQKLDQVNQAQQRKDIQEIRDALRVGQAPSPTSSPGR